jgi:predicted HicB family RNase H-like nuclease
VTFEGENVTGLKKAFKETVEDYLIMCKEAGKEPQNPIKALLISAFRLNCTRKRL